MGYQPWYQGQTYPAIQIPLNTDSAPDNIGSVPVANFTMILRNLGVNPPVDTVGTGIFTVITTNPAVVDYQFSTTDVAQSGNLNLIVEAVFPGTGGGKAVWDPFPFTITPA